MNQPELPQNSQKATLSWTGESKIKVSWADGHESIFTLQFLRRACPCARCKGWPNIADDGFPVIPESQLANIHATDIHSVGRYAIQFMWSDGHMTGYYPYEYLRKICACAECAQYRTK